MKDQLITILEALRLAKAELSTHNSRRVKNAPRTLKRLEHILLNEQVTRALGLVGPNVQAPSVVPTQSENEEEYSR
jgi:hypothetical protein